MVHNWLPLRRTEKKWSVIERHQQWKERHEKSPFCHSKTRFFLQFNDPDWRPLGEPPPPAVYIYIYYMSLRNVSGPQTPWITGALSADHRWTLTVAFSHLFILLQIFFLFISFVSFVSFVSQGRSTSAEWQPCADNASCAAAATARLWWTSSGEVGWPNG